MKSNKRLLIMLPVLLIAAWLAFFGDKTPRGEVAEPTRSAPAAAVTESRPAVAQIDAAPASPAPGGMLRLVSREGLGKKIESEDMHNLFMAKEPPPPPTPPQSEQQKSAPPPPVMPFHYIGRELLDGAWRYFLEKNGQTYVVARGDQVEGFLLDSENDTQIGLVDVATSTHFTVQVDDAQK